jgi:NAD(P)-dependent dehydrogenase (short-subunit alcohol dehydrogenase family)
MLELYILIAVIVVIFILRLYFNGPSCKPTDLSGKIVIVTGASNGIGIPTAEELLKRGAKVIYACRNEEKTRSIINSLDKKYKENAYFIKLDLCNFTKVYTFVEEFKRKFQTLDILVNNAGYGDVDYSETSDGIEQVLNTNTISPVVLTFLLLDILHLSNGKVINVSSRAHTFFDYDKSYFKKSNEEQSNWSLMRAVKQYCFAKLGNVYFTQQLNGYINKKKQNIGVYALHPGAISTGLFQEAEKYCYLKVIRFILKPIFWLVFKSPIKGAQTTLHLCFTKKDDLKSGEYYADCKICRVGKSATADKIAERIEYIKILSEMVNTSPSARESFITLDLSY